MYIFIDESGDLGFTKGGSEFFILCAVNIDDNKKMRKLFKKIKKKERKEIFSFYTSTGTSFKSFQYH